MTQGIGRLRANLPFIPENVDNGLSLLVRQLLDDLHEAILAMDKRILAYDNQIQTLAEQNEVCKRLLTIPGIGHQTSMVLKAAISDPKQFTSGRQMAACLHASTPQEESLNCWVSANGAINTCAPC